MMQALIAPAVLATVIGLWLAWLKRRERAEDHALLVRAEIQSAVNRALEGESLLAVQVEPETAKPVTVVVNGVDGEALPDAGAGVPLEQVTETGTPVVGPVGE